MTDEEYEKVRYTRFKYRLPEVKRETCEDIEKRMLHIHARVSLVDFMVSYGAGPNKGEAILAKLKEHPAESPPVEEVVEPVEFRDGPVTAVGPDPVVIEAVKRGPGRPRKAA